ncbi:MAG TPA: DPP IV N-terminal domain-containing protein [Pyrinomonadaceae bacterium]|nr:DPP IV N-terminal domain-containing protein [Pyrinomonadaceae bacterium]
MKKTKTLLLTIFAVTLITAALSERFASADNDKRALVVLNPSDSVDTRALEISPRREIVGHDADTFGGPPHSIAFHSNRDGNNEVYMMNPDGSDQARLTFESRNDQRPDVSPNGIRIVFASNRIIGDTNPTGDFEIFVMNSDGSDVTQLTLNGTEDSWPRWSPNGQWIAFHSNVDGNFEIYVIRPDGTDLTRVTDYAGLDQFPEWSPNGKQLAIRRDTDLYLIDLDGSNPIQLTAAALINQMASWAPDGKKLAFLSTREGYPSVFVMDTDGSNPVNLTPKPADVPASAWSSRAPGWSRNGQSIYFTARRPEVSVSENIFMMNADGSGVTQLTFTTAPGVSAEAAVR